MSDDEGRLIIDDPNSPDNGGLIIADDSPRKGYLNIVKEMEPSGVTIGGTTRKKVFDPNLTPPYINGKMKERNDEAIEDGEIAEDDELTPEEQMKQIMANQQSTYRSSSSLKSPTRTSRESRESRESRDGRESRESRSNGSKGDGHNSTRSDRCGSSHTHSHLYPHSRGAPGGVRSKPDPLSTPHSHTPAGHLRKSIDYDRDRERKDRHNTIHSLHNLVSSSTASSGGNTSSSSSSSTTIVVPLMALDVPTAVPSTALTEIIERGGDRREDRKRDMKENGGTDRRERNASVSSSTSSIKEIREDEKREREVTPSNTTTTVNGVMDNRRKRESSLLPSIGEEKDGSEPPEKRRKHKEENEEEDEELEEENGRKEKSSSPPPSYSSHGTSVGIQAERDDAILNLPAGSSITLTFTVVCRSEQANNDLNNTLYLSTMIGGREMMCVLTDSEILGMRRRSLASSSSDDSGNRNGTPSKSFRGGNGTPRDKRARNGVERKRRVMVENDEEDSSHDSSGGGEGTSCGLNLKRIELVEKAPKREMHHCTAENCEFRFSRSSELEYHKEEMHRKKKMMVEHLACQTEVSSLLSKSTIECQTDTVIVMTKEEDEQRIIDTQKKIKIEPKVEEERNDVPALTIQTGVGPSSSSSTPSCTGATITGGTLLMKASTSTPSTPINGGDNTHILHHPVAMVAPPSISSSSSMPTLTPAISTPSTPSSCTKGVTRIAGGSGSVSSPRPPHPSSLPLPPPSMTNPPQSIMMSGVNPHPIGTSAHALYNLQFHPAYTAMHQSATQSQQQQQQQQQHKQVGGTGGGSTTQHKINELKVKDESSPSTSSGIAHHPSMVKVANASVAPSMQSPAPNNQRQQQQQQMQPQFVYPVMGMVPPTNAQQQQQQQQMMMQAAAQNQYMQQVMMGHLMNGTRPGAQVVPQQAMQMQAMTPEQQMMVMQMMMQHQQSQQK